MTERCKNSTPAYAPAPHAGCRHRAPITARVLALPLFVALGSSDALGQAVVYQEYSVEILRVTAQDRHECRGLSNGGPDYHAEVRVYLAGSSREIASFDTQPVMNPGCPTEIEPAWAFDGEIPKVTDWVTGRSRPADLRFAVELRDFDAAFRRRDDSVHVHRHNRRIVLDPSDCRIDGPVNGACGEVLTLGDNTGRAPTASVDLRFDVNARVDGAKVDFETPDLGEQRNALRDPYDYDNLSFSSAQANHVVGLVRNSATTACIDNNEGDQMLTSAPDAEALGSSGGAIRAELPEPLNTPGDLAVRWATSVQSGVDAQFRLTLRDASGQVVATDTGSPRRGLGDCGFPGGERGEVRLSVVTTKTVASATVKEVEDPGSHGHVWTIDDFTVEGVTD